MQIRKQTPALQYVAENGPSLPPVGDAIRRVLGTADPQTKAAGAIRLARQWLAGAFTADFTATMPDRPARPVHPALLPPNRMPRRGRGSSDAKRAALLHAIAHIEFNAIDLALDMAGRFGGAMPAAFTDDWLRIAAEEALHFSLIERRLAAVGATYGDLPAHDGLWEAAADTRHDLMARLAVVPMVLEARGLDVTPAMIDRFEALDDRRTARVLRRILRDEKGHVAAGVKWFRICCETAGEQPVATWKTLVKRYYHGALKPPFNDSAREYAGLSREYYTMGC